VCFVVFIWIIVNAELVEFIIQFPHLTMVLCGMLTVYHGSVWHYVRIHYDDEDVHWEIVHAVNSQKCT